MKAVYIYPGSFCPPTYGHLHIVKKAANILPSLYIVCSKNPDKENPLFTPEECKKLWLTYNLPENVSVITLQELIALNIPSKQIVMIRGIRDESDAEYEKKVMFFNCKNFAIDKFFYILCDKEYKRISSSKVRKMVLNKNLINLSSLISPMIISAIVEKTFQLKNIFLVSGKPGSGKSTFLKMLCQTEDSFYHINTDEINHELKPILEKEFPGKDLIDLAINQEEKLKKVIKKPWLENLATKLAKYPPNSTVFIEVPYGLADNKKTYNYLGGKIIYIGCEEEEMEERNNLRGTKKFLKFAEEIPSWNESLEISNKNGLKITLVNTSGQINTLKEKIVELKTLLRGKYYD